MELVELTPLSGALVGLPGVDGLSTEQRKRLTIAVELVANPSIVFMDEPTSGLDARSAAIVMRTVRNIVNTGRTIVCTIHQPSIDIFESFDEVISIFLQYLLAFERLCARNYVIFITQIISFYCTCILLSLFSAIIISCVLYNTYNTNDYNMHNYFYSCIFHFGRLSFFFPRIFVLLNSMYRSNGKPSSYWHFLCSFHLKCLFFFLLSLLEDLFSLHPLLVMKFFLVMTLYAAAFINEAWRRTHICWSIRAQIS